MKRPLAPSRMEVRVTGIRAFWRRCMIRLAGWLIKPYEIGLYSMPEMRTVINEIDCLKTFIRRSGYLPRIYKARLKLDAYVKTILSFLMAAEDKGKPNINVLAQLEVRESLSQLPKKQLKRVLREHSKRLKKPA